jgi:hypothetical protein
MQVPWRDFVRVLRALGYTPAKGKAGSKRYFINPARSPSSVSFNEPHPGDSLYKPVVRRYLRKLQLPEDDFLRLLENG